MPALVEMLGKRFGRLLVIERAGSGPSGAHWKCRCECGTAMVANGRRLRNGECRSCGCLYRETRPSPKRIDLTGQVFDRLTVLGPAEPSTDGRVRWWCLCSCGVKKAMRARTLRDGNARSCGCKRAEFLRGPNMHRFKKGEATRLKHGHTRRGNGGRSREYQAWCGMKNRCLNPTNKKYADYGGRGITVCERWSNSFEVFLADVGPKPSPSHSLDRIDPNGNYEPTNVRWATVHEQMVNKRLSAPRVAAILDAMTAASHDLLERAVLARVRRELLGA